MSKGVGYRWYDSQNLVPEFAFGSGISYTTFEYSNIKVNNPNAKVGDNVEVSFDLKNTGKIFGEEVAQLYISTSKIIHELHMPVKQMLGFEKVGLMPGETKTITILLSPEEFYIYNDAIQSYQVPEGEFIVQIGGSSDILPLKGEFSLAKAEGKADLSVKNIRTMPTFPKEGDDVVFMASLINKGTAATSKGDDHLIRFYVDGKEVASYYSISTAIPAGGMELACAQGLKDANWKATNGNFKVTATIEVSESKDLNLANNTCEGELQIPNGKVIPVDIARIIR